MVSVASLLNPDPPRAPLPSSRLPFASSGSRRVSFADEASSPTAETLPRISMARDAQGPLKARANGQVRFPPFEDLDEAALREVRRFQVRPFPGLIRDNARRIPYNSGKKDFSQKTNRDSFQVFQYEFRLPGDDHIYTVLWDYNIGLVRMTPFFKCCRYSKTTPAKMLNQNPGLRDITHSITGGAITAQGYWMPYDCAKAVCATFCADIAGALIPIFGPAFPSQCTPRLAPNHGRMIIDRAIIEESAREARLFRQQSATHSAPSTPMMNDINSPRLPPRHPRPLVHPNYSPSGGQYYSDGMSDLAYGTGPDTDVDMYSPAGPRRRFLPGPLGPARMEPSMVIPRSNGQSAGWTPINHQPVAAAPYPSERGGGAGYYSDSMHSSCPGSPSLEGPNPWLSALPSRGDGSSYTTHHHYPPPPHHYPGMMMAPLRTHYERPLADDGYDAGESRNGSSPDRDEDDHHRRRDSDRQDAAMVLMNLSGGGSPGDGYRGTRRASKARGSDSPPRRLPPPGVVAGIGEDAYVPKAKRRRATLV